MTECFFFFFLNQMLRLLLYENREKNPYHFPHAFEAHQSFGPVFYLACYSTRVSRAVTSIQDLLFYFILFFISFAHYRIQKNKGISMMRQGYHNSGNPITVFPGSLASIPRLFYSECRTIPFIFFSTQFYCPAHAKKKKTEKEKNLEPSVPVSKRSVIYTFKEMLCKWFQDEVVAGLTFMQLFQNPSLKLNFEAC